MNSELARLPSVKPKSRLSLGILQQGFRSGSGALLMKFAI
jgi:hypothetical protein